MRHFVAYLTHDDHDIIPLVFKTLDREQSPDCTKCTIYVTAVEQHDLNTSEHVSNVPPLPTMLTFGFSERIGLPLAAPKQPLTSSVSRY